jgi:hypothetical protein
MKECFLLAEEETQIRFNFADGQEPLLVEAVELANYIDEARASLPEDTTIEREIVSLVKRKYNRKVSVTAAATMWDVVFDVMESVKKKLYQKPDSSAGIPTPDLPQENSTSSNG